MRLIPAIDLFQGRCVRLLKGEFGQVTYYDFTPLELARRYRDGGADWLHVVDLEGARDGHPAHTGLIGELVSDCGIGVQIGGGLRDAEAVAAVLAAGAARAVVGSVAVLEPERVTGWLERYDADRLVLALDVRVGDDGIPRLATHGWQRGGEKSLWELLAAYEGSGLRHVLCTDIGRDGAMAGPNTGLYAECVDRFPGIAWQASGGVRNRSDLDALASLGLAGVISGRALLEGALTLEEAQPFLPNA